MHILQSDALEVLVLDPKLDLDKLGSRYCVGGYVWQVKDKRLGPLVSGPHYPGLTNGFDGQGLPEVFEIAMGQQEAKVGEDVTVIGVGKVKRTSPVQPFHVRDNPEVAEFAPWKISRAEESLVFETAQDRDGQSLRLQRRLELKNRSLFSHTSVRNTGDRPIAIRWFAHPFFPWAGDRVWQFSLECHLPVKTHWEKDSEGWIVRRKEDEGGAGGYLPLQIPFGYPITIAQKHPLLGQVTMDCAFPLAWLPIWGNENTVSCEPYFHTVLDADGKAAWSMAYHF